MDPNFRGCVGFELVWTSYMISQCRRTMQITSIGTVS